MAALFGFHHPLCLESAIFELFWGVGPWETLKLPGKILEFFRSVLVMSEILKFC